MNSPVKTVIFLNNHQVPQAAGEQFFIQSPGDANSINYIKLLLTSHDLQLSLKCVGRHYSVSDSVDVIFAKSRLFNQLNILLVSHKAHFTIFNCKMLK